MILTAVTSVAVASEGAVFYRTSRNSRIRPNGEVSEQTLSKLVEETVAGKNEKGCLTMFGCDLDAPIWRLGHASGSAASSTGLGILTELTYIPVHLGQEKRSGLLRKSRESIGNKNKQVMETSFHES